MALYWSLKVSASQPQFNMDYYNNFSKFSLFAIELLIHYIKKVHMDIQVVIDRYKT